MYKTKKKSARIPITPTFAESWNNACKGIQPTNNQQSESNPKTKEPMKTATKTVKPTAKPAVNEAKTVKKSAKVESKAKTTEKLKSLKELVGKTVISAKESEILNYLYSVYVKRGKFLAVTLKEVIESTKIHPKVIGIFVSSLVKKNLISKIIDEDDDVQLTLEVKPVEKVVITAKDRESAKIVKRILEDVNNSPTVAKSRIIPTSNSMNPSTKVDVTVLKTKSSNKNKPDSIEPTSIEAFKTEWRELTRRDFDDNSKCFIPFDRAQEFIKISTMLNKKYGGTVNEPTAVLKGHMILRQEYFGLPEADYFKPDPKPTVVIHKDIKGVTTNVTTKKIGSVSNQLINKIVKSEKSNVQPLLKNGEKTKIVNKVVNKVKNDSGLSDADKKFIEKNFTKKGTIMTSNVKEAGKNLYLKCMLKRLVTLNIAKESPKGWIIADLKKIA
ncbi:MAG: hypothetical protein A3F91_15220 [Flavobacteria bacterium RIFCSPLOWO2_12_FULL_35_11]|nr:MAG: hypothetical protein A3F91_15220 [Flavobacteria bacterium RIFCSPLOWO2_12_FULL_35_11]